MLEKFSDSMKETLKKIARSLFVDERLIDELVKDIQRALLAADVNVQLVFDLSKSIKERALNEKPPAGIPQKEHIIKIVYEELVKFLGEEKFEIKILPKKPFKIMMLGLFGSGKSTSCGKLASYYSKRGYKVASLGLDTHRPAAMDQLEQLSKQANIPSFIDKNEKDPVKIYNKFKPEFKKYDILIIDTAGRDALNNELIKEIELLTKTINPDEKLLVISADIGQAAQSQAQQFHDSCSITGIFATKMDGTAKAGGALSACAATKAKIKFIGVGEKINDTEEFNPKGFVSRILGMGDIEALLKKAEEAMDESQAKDLGKKFLKGDYNFLDLYEQMQAMKKMGPLKKIMELVPGASNLDIPKDMLDVQEGKLEKWRFIFQSCTKDELENPDIITRDRIERIAKGSGVNPSDVRDLLKMYKQSKKMMKLMAGKGSGDMNKIMKKFRGKIPKGFKI